jgi:Trk K+ transport system NAD-binding subunit
MSPHPPTGNRFIVCGDNSLAYRIILELTSRYGKEVTVILPSQRENHGPRIAVLPRVSVLERAELTSEAFTDARVQSAGALALAWQDDVGNFHAGLRAQELNPALRLVVAVFNQRLGDHIRGFFPDCTVLTGSAMAAPAFVAAALGEPAPSHVRVYGRTLYVARRGDVDPGHVVCGLAVPDDPAGTTRLLPPGAVSADPSADSRLVLAVADGTPRDPLARRRHLLRTAAGVLRKLTWNKFSLVFAVLLAIAVIGFLLLLSAGHSVSNTVYLGIMDMTGSALTNTSLSGDEKVSQVLLTVDGMALLPVATAIIVGARLTGSIHGEPRPRGGHIIVVGLGNVGTRVVGALHDLGFDVACVDRDPDARGAPLARRLGLPLVVGQGYREDTLRAAGLATCSALVSVTSDDIANLETALQARALREDVRLVLRLGDDDLAQRVQKTLGNIISRSVSYLAAPAFAAAMLEHQVLRTIALGRHVLLIADVRIEPGAGIAGQTLAELEQDSLARILALHVKGTQGVNWSADRGYQLASGDRVIVLATRAGLSRFLAGNRPIVSS